MDSKFFKMLKENWVLIVTAASVIITFALVQNATQVNASEISKLEGRVDRIEVVVNNINNSISSISTSIKNISDSLSDIKTDIRELRK